MPISNITSKISNFFDRTTGTVGRRLTNSVKNDLARSPKGDSFATIPQELSARVQPKINIVVQKATTDADLRAVHQIDVEAFAQTDPVPTDFAEYKSSVEDLTSYVVKNSENKVVGYYQTEPIENASMYVYSIGIPKNLRGTKSSFNTLMAIKDDITKLAQQCRIKTVFKREP